MKTNKLAVLTVNYNKANYTLSLLKSLEQSDFKDFKFFVVDNSSNENDLEELEYGCLYSPLSTKIIYNNKNSGWGSALNKGFKEINKEEIPYTLVINNDTIVNNNSISELLKVIESDSNIGICGPKILDNNGNIQTIGGRLDWLVKFFGITRENNKHWIDKPYILNNKETLDDCAWIIRSSMMNNIKYPDYIFLYFEELYIVLAAQKLGWKLAYAPTSIITHEGQVSSKEKSEKKSKIQIFYLNRNRIIFIKDNYPKLFILSLIGCCLITVPLRIIKSLIKKDVSSIKYIISGMWSGIQYSLLNKLTYFKK